MTDKRAEEVWDEIWREAYPQADRTPVKIISAALAQAKREGVEAMRDAAKIDNYEELDLEKRLDEIAARLLASAPPEAPDALVREEFGFIVGAGEMLRKAIEARNPHCDIIFCIKEIEEHARKALAALEATR